MFGRIERYVFRQVAAAFVALLGALTALVWVTQALRELDLLTLKGQTLVVFLSLTGLLLPTLMLVIAPVALFIAAVYVLNRLNSDSELVAMSASGMSRLRLASPFLALALIVSLGSAFLSLHAAPASMKGFRELLTHIRADVIATILRDGTFTEVEDGLTFHIRERGSDGSLRGLLVSDTRGLERDFAYIAERGMLLETPGGSYLVMEDGSLHRREKASGSVTVIAFEQYAFDLSQFSPSDEVSFYKPKERSTFALLFPDTSDPNHETTAPHIRGELHERLVAPLYPLAFILIAVAFLGGAHSTRQSRWAALLISGCAVGLVRLAGFGAVGLTVRTPMAAPLVYALPVAAIVGGFVVLANGRRLAHAFARLGERAAEAIERVRAALFGRRVQGHGTS